MVRLFFRRECWILLGPNIPENTDDQTSGGNKTKHKTQFVDREGLIEHVGKYSGHIRSRTYVYLPKTAWTSDFYYFIEISLTQLVLTYQVHTYDAYMLTRATERGSRRAGDRETARDRRSRPKATHTLPSDRTIDRADGASERNDTTATLHY